MPVGNRERDIEDGQARTHLVVAHRAGGTAWMRWMWQKATTTVHSMALLVDRYVMACRQMTSCSVLTTAARNRSGRLRV